MSCPGTAHDLTAFKSRRRAAVTGVGLPSSEPAKLARSLSLSSFLGLGVARKMVELVEVEVVEVVTGKTLVFDLLLSAMTRCANFFANPTPGGERPVWGVSRRDGEWRAGPVSG